MPLLSRRGHIFTVIVALALFVLGFWLRGAFFLEQPSQRMGSSPSVTSGSAEVWTCSMHPQIRANISGLCPICGMDLIPVTPSAASDEHPRQFATSEASRALMQIQTLPVERRFVTAKIRMVGKIAFDETRLAEITAWVPGRLDRLYVDYTGIKVNKDDHLVSIYSPELITAQQELRSATRAVENLRAGASEVLRATGEATLEAVRSKLKRWGLTDAQIREAETKNALPDHITIFAPIGGTVIERKGTEGAYVDMGTSIYRIADLSKVWVLLDAYESDLAWLHYGQTITFICEAYPGEVFTGRIAFIDPLLNDATRTVKVRINVANPDERLKPEMFVRALVEARVATGGRVMDPGLAGKWISPMHPEIIKDGPGKCDVCGMPLVRAEDLGYVPIQFGDDDKPLVIPATAPLITGKRAVVYVEVPDADQPTFEGREVELGPRAGEYYLVKSGLQEGERVVVQGNFKIDSALQILAKPSMMSPEDVISETIALPESKTETMLTPREETAPKAAAPPKFREQMHAFLTEYYLVQTALAADDAPAAQQAVVAVQKALDAVDMSLLSGDGHMLWMEQLKVLQEALAMAKSAEEDIAKLRNAFAPLSAALIQILRVFGAPGDAPAHILHCPMAFENKGADWLQAAQETRNPYFGSAMLKCGSVTETLSPNAAAGKAGP